MIVDLETWTAAPALDCNVCIVGAGAAGIAIGTELARSSIRTVILEAGGERVEPQTHALYDGKVSGLPYSGYRTGRARIFGGTTTRWGGQALPLNSLDLEHRDWVEWSGWPISRATLAPFYARAQRFLGLDAHDYSHGLAESLGTKLPEFSDGALDTFFSKWSPEPNMARAHGDTLRRAEHVRVVLHANVTRIDLDEGERVRAVEARSLNGNVLRIAPGVVILACGGLEVPRLLLCNRAQRGSGIGNEYDLVGRFLQDHPGGVLGIVRPSDDSAVQRRFGVYHRKGTRYTVRFSLSPTVQERERTLSASGTLMFVPAADSAFDAARQLYRAMRSRQLRRENVDAIRKITHDLPGMVRTAAWYARGRTFVPRPIVRLVGSFEQEPDPTSRVTLARETDALGMPRLDIHWTLNDALLRTVRVFAAAVQTALKASGIGTVDLESWITDPEANWREKLGDHYHHIGTTRMSDSPRTGVTDSMGRVHSVRNLYVASSALFPTGGHSNPTLTIIALAMRLADHLRRFPASA